MGRDSEESMNESTDIKLPQPSTLSHAGEKSIEVVSSFQYLGSIVQDNCGLDTE